jgi:hypothetical protein
MKMSSPRCLAVVASLSVVLIALPPAEAVNLMERIVTTQTQFIRHEASEYQRKVAEANARKYMAAHVKVKEEKTTSTSKPGKTGGTTSKTDKPESKEKHAAKTKLPRYVAVDTVTDKRSAPGTKKDVMIWDTQSETLVGNSVYDVQNVPTLGSTAKFETYSAQYVGDGRGAGL